MTLLRRFAENAHAKVMTTVADADDVPPGDAAPAASEPVAADRAAPAPAPHPVIAAAVTGAARSADAPPTDPTIRRSLVILKSLTPVFRAALLYPGVEAGTEAFGQAVHRMAAAAASLVHAMVDISDPLEVDTAWARRTLQELGADLVAHHWVSGAIASGGGESPPLPLDGFVASLKAVLAIPWPTEGNNETLETTTTAAVRLSFLKAFAPLAVEVEKYAEIINRRLEQKVVDAPALQRLLGQALMEQAVQGRNLLMAEDEGTADDRRMTLQACLAHIGSLYMAAWEPTRGDALGRLVDADTPSKAREALAGEGFAHGFPVEAFRARTMDAAKRLLGTTQAAMDLMAPAEDLRQRREG